MTKTLQVQNKDITMSYLHLTLNDSCHKHAQTLIHIQDVMSWLWRCHINLKHTSSSKMLPLFSQIHDFVVYTEIRFTNLNSDQNAVVSQNA